MPAGFRRCWNCKHFQHCTDFRTFARGCLYCTEGYEVNLKVWQWVRFFPEWYVIQK